MKIFVVVRIPRRVTGDGPGVISCVKCGLRHVLADTSHTETVIVITSDHSLDDHDDDDSSADVEQYVHKNKIPIFLITFPASDIRKSLGDLTKYGAVFAVHQDNPYIHPYSYLQVGSRSRHSFTSYFCIYFYQTTLLRIFTVDDEHIANSNLRVLYLWHGNKPIAYLQ